MKNAISWLAAAYAAVALTSFIAVRSVSGVLDEMGRQGGGFAALTEGIAEAARWPVVGAWLAAVASLVALAMARRAAASERPVSTAAMSAVAIAAGAVAVLAFRGVTSFILDAVTPGSLFHPGEISGRLTGASLLTVFCFAAAITVVVLALRTPTARRAAVLAVVVSLGVSAALIVTLHDLRARYVAAGTGDMEGLEELINRPFRGSPPSSNAGR